MNTTTGRVYMKTLFIILLAIATIGSSSVAIAQQPTPVQQAVQSAVEQALGAKEVAGIVCNATVADLQRQLADARKQIEELKKPKDEAK